MVMAPPKTLPDLDKVQALRFPSWARAAAAPRHLARFPPRLRAPRCGADCQLRRSGRGPGQQDDGAGSGGSLRQRLNAEIHLQPL